MKDDPARSGTGGQASPGLPGGISGYPRYFSHSGSSMVPALFEGDLLELSSFTDEPIRIGDVVIFHAPVDGISIAHRVISTSHEGISVRGDNNMECDPWVLRRSSIVGRVVAVWRMGKRKRVYGGMPGMVLSRLGRLEVSLYRAIMPCLARFSNLVSRTGILRAAIIHILRPKIIMVRSRDGPSMILSARGRAAGSYDPKTGLWKIGWIYRLFIDEAKLPKGRSQE